MSVFLSLRTPDGRSFWLIPFLAAGACMFASASRDSRADQTSAATGLLEDLRSFREMGSVLHIAAHPDDENTQLIVYLARGRHYRTAYLSLTRGDGGQNVIGPEFFEELGVIRTQELLAARRLDGGRQFFTRAIDFGFSKSPGETLRIWDRQQVLADIVRIIRTFRPDVLITRFSPQGGGHGHHTASAVLALEAFKLAGDSKAFPEQLKELTPWQPRRILQNGGGPGRGGGGRGGAGAGSVRMEIDGNDPVSGQPLGTIAGRSRAMHKSQGFGNFGGGGRGGGGARTESFSLLGGEPATKDILDGVDTTWGRVPGGALIGTQADAIIAQFNPKDPAASVPALLALRTRLAGVAGDRVVDEKRRLLDHIVQGCLGLEVATVVPQAEVVPGEALAMRHVVTVRSSIPVRWLTVRYPAAGPETGVPIELHANQTASRESSRTLPEATPPSQPYWLRDDHATGLFRVDNPALIGQPENPAAFPVEQVFEVGGQTLAVPDEPVQIMADAGKGEIRRPLEVIPPVSLRFSSEVRLLAPGAEGPVEVEVTSSRAGAAGALELDAPAGWRVTPASQPFRLAAVGDQTRLSFTVAAPAHPASAWLTARARIGGSSFSNQRIVIRYDHIPVQLLQPPARLKAVALDLAIRGHKVGYLPGAGDNVAECLEAMGYAVTRLTGADLTPDGLRGLDAVVIGVRAFNVRNDIAAGLPSLFAYAEAGGTVVVQYNRPDGAKTGKVAPYKLQISQSRVTDENATVTFLAPDHPVLTSPNKISAADFEGWVQERGIYFPDQWDQHFTPILAFNDPGEASLKGGLLVAGHGRGHFVYTGLVFFRELPAGVPGAYRLFANLVSLGK
jgi:LmbE family N-acetylglucosaminyl deacetylase